LKVVDVEWVVQYRVDDPNKYLHRVRDIDKTIRDVSEAVMRRIVGNSLGSDVLTVKAGADRHFGQRGTADDPRFVRDGDHDRHGRTSRTSRRPIRSSRPLTR
jgi:hypothetical protein